MKEIFISKQYINQIIFLEAKDDGGRVVFTQYLDPCNVFHMGIPEVVALRINARELDLGYDCAYRVTANIDGEKMVIYTSVSQV